MKSVVIYKSKYGSTEKYAQWIAEDLETDLFKAADIKNDILKNYDTIVYCGGLYADGILGFSLIKRIFERLIDKKLVVVAVGATLKNDTAIEEIKKRNFTSKMQNKVPLFLLRGCLNYKKMNVIDKFLMFLLVKSLKKKKDDELDNDSKGIIATYGKVTDFTSRESIAPIIDYLKG